MKLNEIWETFKFFPLFEAKKFLLQEMAFLCRECIKYAGGRDTYTL
jgi:hypothetical protein